MDCIKKGSPLWLKGTGRLTDETVEKLLQTYPKPGDIAHALQVNETIAEYRVMKKFTANLRGEYQAHHILEEAMAKDLKLGSRNTDKLPSVVLTKADHQKITDRRRTEPGKAMGKDGRMTAKK